jgi:hypothetical protein
MVLVFRIRHKFTCTVVCHPVPMTWAVYASQPQAKDRGIAGGRKEVTLSLSENLLQGKEI